MWQVGAEVMGNPLVMNKYRASRQRMKIRMPSRRKKASSLLLSPSSGVNLSRNRKQYQNQKRLHDVSIYVMTGIS